MGERQGPSHVYVGAARFSAGAVGGIFRCAGGDDRWEPLAKGLPERANVQAITVHPTNADIVYAGTQDGPYRSVDRGERWERLDFTGETEVWSILVHPTRPRTLYAGTAPVGIFRSDDGGDTWRRLPARSPDRVKMSFACRVMRLAADPARPDELYATLEVGGVLRSRDGGESWEDMSAALVALAEQPHLKSRIQSDSDTEGMLDGHAVCVSAAAPGTVFLAVRMGLFRSADRGAGWQDIEIGRFSPLTYARDVAGIAAGSARALRLPQPRRAQRGRLALPQPGPRQDVDAVRPRGQGREYDDGRRAASSGCRPGPLRQPDWPGVQHRGRRPGMERAPAARGRPGCVRHRLRLMPNPHDS